MTRYLFMVSALCGALLLSGCGIGSLAYLAPVKPPNGILVTAVKAPLSTDFDSTPVSSAQGKATTFYVRDPLITGMDFAWGNADLDAAMRDGDLSRVEYADYRITQVLLIFGMFTVYANGA